MQVQNDTDEDLDIEIQGGRPGIDDHKHRGVVKKKDHMPLPPGFGPIRRARIHTRGTVDCLWVQHFDPPAHDLVIRDAIVAKND